MGHYYSEMPDNLQQTKKAIKSKELFDFAVSYLTADSKMISLSYFTDTGTIGFSLLSEECDHRSAVLELSDRLQITTVLDILLFAIEKNE